MPYSEELAARILIVYESRLPFDRRASLAERTEAMRKAVDSLGLFETSKADLRTIVAMPPQA